LDELDKLELMSQVETIFFDESGTPGDAGSNGLFVVGGFSIRGDPTIVADNWNAFLDKNKLHGKKGKKYDIGQLLEVAEFLCTNHAIPITAYSRLGRDDLDMLREKIREYKKSSIGTKVGLRLEPPTYLWCMHVGIAVVTSYPSLLIWRGPIEQLVVSIDQYLSQAKLEELTRDVFRKFFSRSSLEGLVKPILNSHRYELDVQSFLAGMDKARSEFLKLDWNSKGRLALLADVVCSLYRRSLSGDGGARAAWGVLRICFGKSAGDKVPNCMGQDITSSIRDIISRPWIAT
jgi:hypothetical protein